MTIVLIRGRDKAVVKCEPRDGVVQKGAIVRILKVLRCSSRKMEQRLQSCSVKLGKEQPKDDRGRRVFKLRA